LKAIATPGPIMEPFSRLASLPKGTPADIEGVAFPSSMLDWVDSIPNDLLEVVSIIAQSQGGVWVVGGSVRQGLGGVEPQDYDLATTLQPQQIMEIFGSNNSIDIGAKYGTVTVRIESSLNWYEVTTLRCDQEYLDGRRPESVIFGNSLLEDLERRDLTINAMAVDLARQELYDPFGGLDDLNSGILQAVGDASTRLSEDGLRVMRAYRFMDQGDAGIWMPDDDLSVALKECQHMLENVSIERIWQELRRIISSKHAAKVLNQMSQDGVLNTIFEGYEYNLEGQNEITEISENLLEVRLAMMFKDGNSNDLMKRLKVPKSIINDVISLINCISHVPDANSIEELRLYRAVLGDRLDQQLICESALKTSLIQDVKSSLDSLPENRAGVSPIADGNWIAEVTGLSKGIKLGRLKEWLHRIQIEEDLVSLEEIESHINHLPWQEGNPTTWPRFRWP
tara:strand:- start:1498 stop:2856 length:1359 start_codon:yes stop_codon:yes gene_type:complete